MGIYFSFIAEWMENKEKWNEKWKYTLLSTIPFVTQKKKKKTIIEKKIECNMYHSSKVSCCIVSGK